MAVQEEIEQKSFNIMISTTKLSARTVLRAVKAAFRLYQSKASQGKQSVRTLLRQNRGVSSVEISKTGIRGLERYAKKYGKKVYAAVSNMSIAMERRDFLQQIDCFVCNQQEAGLMFSDDYDHLTPDEMRATLAANVRSANIPCMVVTMGEQGAVYARTDGESGMVPAKKVDVIDTTGAGDAFFAGTVIGLTYGKTLAEACEIGSRLAASVICISENVCPRFRPQEFGLDVPVTD